MRSNEELNESILAHLGEGPRMISELAASLDEDPKRVRTALGKLRAKGEAHAGGRGPRVAWHLGAGEPKADKPKPKRAKGRKPAATKRLTVEDLAAPVIMPATQDVTLPALMHALLTAPEGRVKLAREMLQEMRGA